MKKDIHKYTKWPADGVCGISADDALSMARAGDIKAYVYIKDAVECCMSSPCGRLVVASNFH